MDGNMANKLNGYATETFYELSICFLNGLKQTKFKYIKVNIHNRRILGKNKKKNVFKTQDMLTSKQNNGNIAREMEEPV